MRNRYPGICYFCGKPVAKGAGHFEKIADAAFGWRTIHAECVFVQRAQKQAKRELETKSK